ncbi:hypothetical protein PM3016_2797 [Paenibacillus mucilaginosus 3016]|uniref:DUF3231 family protein n=1 Tax=Paenibacillus mucilaginosus 3016 TaxID=1116391 RepID=H6NJJ3_9BACL|nr:DUF3231 family protein [Paenibacillus mucilaginosus]AFC29673.1 hypothetical protein PM3016_2797 [Paenibacillus mucilaginosus 3016]WFA18351.1 DUF3231 family protein [Paenibacillus mucilaginosus]
METAHNIPLTAPEISNLWSGYQGDTLSRCVLTHFAAHVEDTEVRELIAYALELCDKHITRLLGYFETEKIPVPQGFGDEDVDPKAPRLFSDIFYLGYLLNMGKQGMALYAYSVPVSSRQDIREYLSECLASSSALYNRTLDLMLAKGVYVRPPRIPVPEAREYVHKESYFYALFEDKRPVNGPEIAHLYANIVTNLMGKALTLGFAQTAVSKDIRAYLLRGHEISGKHVEVFSSLLRDDGLPAPNYWDDGVTASTTPPYSDRLMMYHIGALSATGAVNYGVAAPNSTRRDITSVYVRLIGEIAKYGEDGAELMLKHQWMEKIPGAVERGSLVHQS